MKKHFFLLLVGFILFSLFFHVTITKSDQLDDINSQISKLQTQLNESINATKPLQSQVESMQEQISSIKSQIVSIDADIVTKKADIARRENDLTKQVTLLNAALRDYYIKNYTSATLLLILSSNSAADITQLAAYQKAATDEDKLIVTNTVITLQDLQTRKKDLEDEETRLISTKSTLDQESTQLNKVIAQAQTYQASLNGQIAALTAQQQQLIAQKYASLNIPQTAYAGIGGGCSSDISVDPGFSPRFALFTYGVPNRVGMNQYGAFGRAQAGQSYSDILNAYYQGIQITTVSTSTNITVNGTNDYGETFSNQQWSIEDYVKHVYEMPTSWPSEALKAQAIAARSYALAVTSNGSSPICPDQHCQEVKQEQNTDAWVQAVNATAGQVMENGGQPIKAWFSSTHGGYELSGGNAPFSAAWTKSMTDTTSGSASSFADLQANAYDKASPWFYCDWGSRSQYNGTAWLKPSELADIVNVIMLSQADSSTISHLSQPDKSIPDTWDASRVSQELSNRGITPYTSVSSVSVSADFGQGIVSSVNVSGDGSVHSFSGGQFKTMFNLRAPANIQIVGPLYNIEEK